MYGEMETPQISAQVLNENFVDMLEQGHTKEAQEAGTPIVREVVRQEAASRHIITAKPILPSELDLPEDSDQPMKYMDVEPQSVASFVQFYGTPKTKFYTMRRVPVFFGKISSDEFTKSIFELMSYRNDVRKLLADNAPKDIADQEDILFRRLCLMSVNRNPTAQRTHTPRLNAKGWIDSAKALVNRRRPYGKALMSQSRFLDAVDLPATTVGSDIARKNMEEGLGNRDTLWGIPVVTTMKSDIWLPDESWLFSPENYLGKSWLLKDVTLYVEQRADIVKFFAYEAIGTGFAQVLGIQQIIYTGN